jgi:8-oxo-dGTP pyrophosphatase MutT (NUDIX family)
MMKLPIFNPREIPSRPLSTIDDARSLPPLLSRGQIEKALSAQKDAVLMQRVKSSAFLHRDIHQVNEPRDAAVLILLVEQEEGLEVVFTVRASHLRHHAGQISFVGGAVETGEEALAAALREAREEIGLDVQPVTVLGMLPIYHTITGFAVTPIVACVSAHDWGVQNLMVDAREVDHVFTVPLSVLLNPDLVHVHDYEWENALRQYYSVTYGEYFIWGASMAMLRNLDVLLRLTAQIP